MSVLDGFKKIKKHEKLADGYKLLSQWTSSHSVEFDDGKTAQEKLGGIDGITDSLESDSSVTSLSAKAGKELKETVDGKCVALFDGNNVDLLLSLEDDVLNITTIDHIS